VTAEEGRRVEDPGEVHRLVEVALAGRAVAEVRGDDPVLVPVVERPRGADRVREVRRDADVQREDVPLRDRFGPGLVAHPVGEVLREQVADDHRPVLAVLVADQVVLGERVGRPDRRPLLARAGRVRPDAPLSLEAHRALVEAARDHQVAVYLAEPLVRQVGDRRVGQGAPVRSEHAVDVRVGERVGRGVVGLGGVGVVGAVLVHTRSVCAPVTRS
jgi:hypothetical protein